MITNIVVIQILHRATGIGTRQQLEQRPEYWLTLAYLRNQAEIMPMPTRLVDPLRPYDCDVTRT